MVQPWLLPGIFHSFLVWTTTQPLSPDRCSGQQIISGKYTPFVDISNLDTGVYFIEVNGTQESFRKAFGRCRLLRMHLFNLLF
jgi:hypothetical protein